MFGHADIVLGMDWLSKYAAEIDIAAHAFLYLVNAAWYN
jgi:hypothetical protein